MIRPRGILFTRERKKCLDNLLAKSVFSSPFQTQSAKEALANILSKNKFTKHDLITILTPSQSPYVSSCVTKTISKVARWNRVLTNETKAVVLINEFGFVVDIEKIRREFKGLIIEDNAYCFPLILDDARGKYKDYSIYSLPKFFGGSSGGLCIEEGKLSSNQRKEIRTKLEKSIKKNNYKRQKIYLQYQSILNQNSLIEYENKKVNLCRSMFFIEYPHAEMNKLCFLKSILQRAGIECTIFYPHHVLMLPINPSFDNGDVASIFSLVNLHMSQLDQQKNKTDP